MPARNGSVHVAKIVRRHKGKQYITYLLRRSYRDGKKVLHETLGNISHLPERLIDIIRRSLGGEEFVSAEEAFRTTRSLPHGHVDVVLRMIRKLALEKLIASKRSRQRDLVLAMIVQRVIFPCSKLATTRNWHTTTLAEELAVEDAQAEDLYAAMDWLLRRQRSIEKKLAERHLADGGLVLYDISSSYYTGRTCSLARYGHDRDGKKGRPIIVYGVLTDAEGRPVAVEVYPGNTGDPTTVPDQVEKLRARFGLSRVVLAGDRGMLTQTQIETLKKHPELGWISALRSEAIRQLIAKGTLGRSLFDEVNLAEIHSPDFPDERLVACYNPLLADERGRRREELLVATEKELEKLGRQVARRTKRPMPQAEIALKAGRFINRFKMAKHIRLTIAEGTFSWQRDQESIQRETQLDGIYVIRTSESEKRLSAEDSVRCYKLLTNVEQAFRSFKSQLKVRPIGHRIDDRVRAHILICLLAYYVQWHLKRAWAPLLFEEEDLSADRRRRDPVAPAEPSAKTQRKKATRQTDDELPVHSFETLIQELGTRCRNTCLLASDPSHSFQQLTDMTALQAEAFKLLNL
jgi:transposase